MKKALHRSLGAATVAAALLGISAQPAMAAASACPSNYVCMWEDSNYSGDMWVKYQNNSNSGNKFEIDGWDGDNEISSIVNNTSLYLIVFANDDYEGATRCYSPNSKASSLGSFNDNAESFILRSDCDDW